MDFTSFTFAYCLLPIAYCLLLPVTRIFDSHHNPVYMKSELCCKSHNMKKVLVVLAASILGIMCLPQTSKSQQYKLKQSTNMMNMKMETTIYVKGMRKRTEGGEMMGMGEKIVTIEQCDLKRYIKINDKKKLYFIQPFNENDEVVIEEGKPNKVVPAQQKKAGQKGGTIHMYYNIRDTGERKKMYGFTARHIWTSQKIKPGPDACSMKDSIIIKTDGWYIDLPQFNCPTSYRPSGGPSDGRYTQPDCMDRYVTHTSGKGKLGFPLIQTTTIIMGANSNSMETSLETLEFTTTKLDSMLFEIPIGYTLAKSEDELQGEFKISEYINGNNENKDQPNINNTKKPGYIRVGILQPTGNEELQPGVLQKQMVNSMTTGKIEAIAVNNKEDAQKLQCDYILESSFTQIKQSGGKVTGVLKAIKKGDPSAASSFEIQADMILKKISDDSIHHQQKLNSKYDGRINEAAGQALEEGCEVVIKVLRGGLNRVEDGCG